MAGWPLLGVFAHIFTSEAQFPPEQCKDHDRPSGGLHGASGKQGFYCSGPRPGRREGRPCLTDPSKPLTSHTPGHKHSRGG